MKKSVLIISFCVTCMQCFLGCATAQGSKSSRDSSIYSPHEHVQKVRVADKNIPFSKRFLMAKDDAFVFILPNNKSVSVWSWKSDHFFHSAGSQAQSGLTITWGEKPWIQPTMKYRSLGNNSYEGDGWDSYIEQGKVVTRGSETIEYTLFVDKWRFTITEELSAKVSLPVTITITTTVTTLGARSTL